VKKNSIFFFVFLLFALLPVSVSAAMIKIDINYKPGEERNEYGADIKDGYWNFPAVKVPKSREKEQYSVIIESYDTKESKNEKIEINGAEFSRRHILLPVNGVITFVNKEDFQRQISIIGEGESEPVTVTVPPKSFVQQPFIAAGSYKIIDGMFSWNTISVNVLTTNYVWTLKENNNRRDVPDIAPGSYTLKIYYGTTRIYSDAFTVVENAVQNFTYKIENGRVTNLDTLSTSRD